ncbi:uncharacterized protein LOC114190266 [Vigna unguiculata]|uniref:uncharacterized protein LOC114190266 n=1 Tax=Vigna unguiculata TaxID=3917 RepID=UPI00101713A2|nr:uncharacterized protein LOC114190266 [Vigna unguiculata]
MEALRQMEESRTTTPVFGPEPRPVVREWSLEDFLKHRPAKFDGKTSPDAADQWLKDLERVYDAKMCPVEDRLAFSVYMLTGEAEHWWSSTRSILEERDEPVTWETFREKFLSEYFPDSIRYAKEVEVMEKMKREVEGQRPPQSQPPQRIGGPSGSRPRYEEQRRPYDRPHHQPQESRSFPPQQGRVRCYSCGGPHPRYACPRREGYRRCNNCGKEGHFGRDCPNLSRAATRPPVQAPHQH